MAVMFDAIKPTSLEPIAVVAQCLDNQWVPNALLQKMIAKGQSLGDVRRSREPAVRSEYLRGLVNAKQVVINRAYLYNNPAVVRDYRKPGADRDAFQHFLNTGVVVPFLFAEETPDEDDAIAFDKDPAGFRAWQAVCRDSRTKCVRLSWDQHSNSHEIRNRLVDRFRSFAVGLTGKDFSQLAQNLGLPREAEDAFRHRLVDVADMCNHWIRLGQPDREHMVNRNNLYREFVVHERSKVDEGHYDPGKPFAGAIKRILDLDYNVNLPDALRRYPLTPIDSLDRVALQEWKDPDTETAPLEEIVDRIRRFAFAQVEGGLYLQSMGRLGVTGVRALRETEEWYRYIASLEALVANPLNFVDEQSGAPAVYDSYVRLAQAATRIAVDQHGQASAAWAPRLQFVLQAAGATLLLLPGGVIQVLGTIASTVATQAVPLTVRLVVRGATTVRADADLSTSIDFMRLRLDSAAEGWEWLVNQFGVLQEYQRAMTTLASTQHCAVMHAPVYE